MQEAQAAQPVLELRGINKSFPGVRALKDVDFALYPGEVHGLVGENGAGKSTLMNVLGGVFPCDSGKIFLNGTQTVIDSTSKAEQLGISFVHQELSLFPNLDIASNLYIQNMPREGGFLDKRKLYADTERILAEIELSYRKPRTLVGDLRLGEQQLVEIGKALAQHTKILVLDEPTSSLTKTEIRVLIHLIQTLKKNGVAIVFISHRLDEIYEICDRITIMRDGARILTSPIREITRGEIVRNMIGREVSEMYTHMNRVPGEELLRVEHLSRKNVLGNIRFSIHRGEIVGLYGLMGSGRTEIMKSVFGLYHTDSCDIYVRGKKVEIKKPEDAIKEGIALVTEDRHHEGLVLNESVKFNYTLANLDAYRTSLGTFNQKKESQRVIDSIGKLNIKTPSAKRQVRYLSGGNQQKVVVAKWLETNPQIILLDEPTRGIDVGAKRELYKLMEGLLETGVGILMISSELPEVLSLCDHVLVLKEGSIVADIPNEELNSEHLLVAAMGV